MFLPSFWILVAIQLVAAQAPPAVHTVKVGAGSFAFTPQALSNIPVGDTVSFEFYPPDHSVARAEYGSACVPYEQTGRDKVGFWSGEQVVGSVAEITHFNITINSTEPIFFYCAAKGSCTRELMVGAINPNATQTLEKQIESAKNSKFQLAPGEPMPREGGGSSPTPTPTPSAASSPSEQGHKISTTVIIGAVVGVVAFLGLCGALFFFIGRSRSLKAVVNRRDDDALMKPVGVGGGYTELGYVPQHRGSMFPPQTPQGGNPQGFGSPLPPYASPQMDASGVQYFGDQKAAQPMVAELHSPTLGRQEFAAELEAPYMPTQEKRR